MASASNILSNPRGGLSPKTATILLRNLIPSRLCRETCSFIRFPKNFSCSTPSMQSRLFDVSANSSLNRMPIHPSHPVQCKCTRCLDAGAGRRPSLNAHPYARRLFVIPSGLLKPPNPRSLLSRMMPPAPPPLPGLPDSDPPVFNFAQPFGGGVHLARICLF